MGRSDGVMNAKRTSNPVHVNPIHRLIVQNMKQHVRAEGTNTASNRRKVLTLSAWERACRRSASRDIRVERATSLRATANSDCDPLPPLRRGEVLRRLAAPQSSCALLGGGM